MNKITHWLRKQIWGECPKCKSTHIEDIAYRTGWRKNRCKDCGEEWNR